MSVITYPLNGIDYTADDAETYLCTRVSGVYASDGHFDASVTGNREITVGPGLAWIRNSDHCGKSVYNDAPVALTVPVADGALPRIDRIVLRFSKTESKSELAILTGTASSGPEPPDLTRTELVYELGLYTISVGASSLIVNEGDITDTRMDEEVCGLMRDGVTGLPTQEIYDEFEAWYARIQSEAQERYDMFVGDTESAYRDFCETLQGHDSDFCETMQGFEDAYQAEFTEWFENVRGQLSEDVAGHLQNEIDELEDNIAPAFSEETPYTAGDYCIYEGTLYVFMRDKDAGEWDASAAMRTSVRGIVGEAMLEDTGGSGQEGSAVLGLAEFREDGEGADLLITTAAAVSPETPEGCVLSGISVSGIGLASLTCTAPDGTVTEYDVSVLVAEADSVDLSSPSVSFAIGAAEGAAVEWDEEEGAVYEASVSFTYQPEFSEIKTHARAINEIIGKVYPVGSIYMSVVPASPEDMFGGEWEQIEDCFLLAAGSSYGAGDTGGAATVTLTTAQMPEHTHTGPSHTHSLPSHTHSIPALSGTAASAGAHTHDITGTSKAVASGSNYFRVYYWGEDTTTSVKSAGAHTHTVTTTASTTGSASGTSGSSGTGATGSTGAGEAHNNMPPYLAVYMWQRVA